MQLATTNHDQAQGTITTATADFAKSIFIPREYHTRHIILVRILDILLPPAAAINKSSTSVYKYTRH